MATEAALRREIEQLTAAINSRKAQPAPTPTYYGQQRAYQPHNSYAAPRNTNTFGAKQEVVLNGTTYVSSSRKLTLKNATPSVPTASGSGSASNGIAKSAPTTSAAVPAHHQRTAAGHRLHKATPVFTGKPRRQPRPSRNKVLNNVIGTTTTTTSGRAARKDRPRKQCRFFTMTGTRLATPNAPRLFGAEGQGVCKHARTCQYEHDANKVAICPRFLQGECPFNASQCPLSHDPTPERVPLCVHFANAGRCNKGSACMYPHVNVGKREGVCRDFAVLGYCEKGAECDKQHVRECPNFAEAGRCDKKGCKLPHVIRANRTRKVDPTATAFNSGIEVASGSGKQTRQGISGISGAFVDVEPSRIKLSTTGEEEFIPLTFHESSSEDEDDSDDESSDEDADDSDAASGEGAGDNDDDRRDDAPMEP